MCLVLLMSLVGGQILVRAFKQFECIESLSCMAKATARGQLYKAEEERFSWFRLFNGL